MIEMTYIIAAYLAGIVLGIIFFGGLWFTVKKAVTSKIPALWVMGSFFLRTGITLTGFYFVGSGNWQRILICLAGFITARFLMIRFTRTDKMIQPKLKKEVEHETES